jgi:hypothetical protein
MWEIIVKKKYHEKLVISGLEAKVYVYVLPGKNYNFKKRGNLYTRKSTQKSKENEIDDG